MKVTVRTAAIAMSTFVCAALWSLGWAEKGGVSLSVNKAEAQQRVYITRGYAARAAYVEPGSWYAVRAYYFGGPWSGAGYSYTGWGRLRGAPWHRLHAWYLDQGRGQPNVCLSVVVVLCRGQVVVMVIWPDPLVVLWSPEL